MRDLSGTYMKVFIYSRKAIKKILQSGLPNNTADISFYDPPNIMTGEITKPVNFKGIAKRVFTIMQKLMEPC